MQKIIYIAGPMTGLPDFNYPAFDAAEEQLVALGHRVLNPTHAEALNPTPGTPQAWDWYMRLALKMVTDAQAIALLPGWEKSRGAQIEFNVANALGIDVRPLQQWLEGRAYVVCNHLLDVETNEYCEFDGEVEFKAGLARCPGCRRLFYASEITA